MPSIPTMEPSGFYLNFIQDQKQLATKARSNLDIRNHESDNLLYLKLTIYTLKTHDAFY